MIELHICTPDDSTLHHIACLVKEVFLSALAQLFQCLTLSFCLSRACMQAIPARLDLSINIKKQKPSDFQTFCMRQMGGSNNRHRKGQLFSFRTVLTMLSVPTRCVPKHLI